MTTANSKGYYEDMRELGRVAKSIADMGATISTRWTLRQRRNKGVVWEGGDNPYTIAHGERHLATIHTQHDAAINARLMTVAPELVDALVECITSDGAACWKNRKYAEMRIRYIDRIARRALALVKACEAEDGTG